MRSPTFPPSLFCVYVLLTVSVSVSVSEPLSVSVRVCE